MGAQLGRRGDLLDSTASHDYDHSREEQRLVQVVRDEDARHAKASAERGERVLELRSGDRIERTERLVEKQHRGFRRQGAGNRDTLALSAGELPRPSAGESRRIEADKRQRLAGARGGVPYATQAQHQFDVSLHAPVRQQAAVLRHVADSTSEVDRVERGRVGAIDTHDPGIRIDEAVERTKESGLAGSALADERDGRARRDLERDIVERDDVSEPFGQVLRGERGGHFVEATDSPAAVSCREAHIG